MKQLSIPQFGQSSEAIECLYIDIFISLLAIMLYKASKNYCWTTVNFQKNVASLFFINPEHMTCPDHTYQVVAYTKHVYEIDSFESSYFKVNMYVRVHGTSF